MLFQFCKHNLISIEIEFRIVVSKQFAVNHLEMTSSIQLK